MIRRAMLPGLVAVAMAVGLVSSVSAEATAASLHEEDLYFRAGYESQVNSYTCTAASSAMMLNFIARRDLRLDQRYMLDWAQSRDALNDNVQKGTDPLGWSRMMTYFSTKAGRGAFTYTWQAYSTEYIALKRAARVIAERGMPVGLLVQSGKHAVVMTGFEATRDPRDGDFQLVSVWISDPLGSRHRQYDAASSPMNSYRELDATAGYDQAWYGNYIIIAPPL